MNDQRSLVLRIFNSWHLNQLLNEVRSEGTAHKIRKRRGVLYNDELWRYMNCAPFRHFSLHASHALLSPEVDKSQYESPVTSHKSQNNKKAAASATAFL